MTALTLADLGVPVDDLPGDRLDWNDEGVVIHRRLISDGEIDAYREAWLAENGGPLGQDAPEVWRSPGGFMRTPTFSDPTPYMRVPALRALCCNPLLAHALHELTGESMAVNLNLTGWVTTTRNWHADAYLNPPEVGDYYAAVWIALEDIDPRNGPFQYVAGSHRWPQVTRQAMLNALGTYDEQHWPRESERILTPLYEAEIARRDAVVMTPQLLRGDVLIWHGRLLHRGSSYPGEDVRPRRALIAHYSGINHRPDMPPAQRHPAGGWFFPLP